MVRRAGVEALLGAGGDQPHVAKGGSGPRRRPAVAAMTATPDALSFAPGRSACCPACAIAMRRQDAGVSSTPITLCERPRPRHGELLGADPQARGAEAAGDQAVDGGFAGAGGGPQAPRRYAHGQLVS